MSKALCPTCKGIPFQEDAKGEVLQCPDCDGSGFAPQSTEGEADTRPWCTYCYGTDAACEGVHKDVKPHKALPSADSQASAEASDAPLIHELTKTGSSAYWVCQCAYETMDEAEADQHSMLPDEPAEPCKCSYGNGKRMLNYDCPIHGMTVSLDSEPQQPKTDEVNATLENHESLCPDQTKACGDCRRLQEAIRQLIRTEREDELRRARNAMEPNTAKGVPYVASFDLYTSERIKQLKGENQ